eukprot:CAMPEP_0197233766 /NCGR_PEP_ID=MMETSP1429-20130617/1743_1 /TAXON_ID=49237 /ORGANISM="Chaetoceros  sp., Strain UNC1202" /LENGTH=671 /DNA_ID=CAMNT_0042692073 /DNA_START=94 /DNA_END=2109 /DNA_ORIENTATION=-
MTETSLTDIALMIMVNVLFTSNFLFVRKLRDVVDTFVDDDKNTILKRLRQNFSDSRAVQGFKGFFSGYRKAVNSNDEFQNNKGKTREIVYAALLGKHRMDPMTEQKFPDWQPIPFKLGMVSTALVLLISTVLLSDNALTGKLAISTQGDKSSGFCSTDDVAEKMTAFKNHIRGQNVTNYDMAEKQFNVALQFNNTLATQSTTKWIDQCDAQALANENARIKDMCTFSQKICVDGWGLSIICKRVRVTLPSCVTALQGASLNAEEPEIDPLESDADISALEQLNQGSAALVQKLLKQIDIAGSLYSFYVCVALFFPTPIDLFRPSLTVRSKRLLCGVNKYTFMVTILIIYWGYEYFFKLLALPQVQIFFKNLVTDPCFLDGEFIKNRTAVVKNTCTELIKQENYWGLIDSKINGALDIMSDCTIKFPSCSSLQDSDNLDRDALALTKPFSTTSGRGCDNVWAVSEFLGNERICTDFEYSRDEILVSDDTGLSWWELWMKSGLLASLLVKFSIVNFGVALLKLADPFYICNGSYESPPELLNQDLSEEGGESRTLLHVDNTIKDNKIAALQAIAFRDCLFWGFLTNCSLLSLVIASSSRLDKFKALDYVWFTAIIVLSFGAAASCFAFTKYSVRVVDEQVSTGEANFTPIPLRKKKKGLFESFPIPFNSLSLP